MGSDPAPKLQKEQRSTKSLEAPGRGWGCAWAVRMGGEGYRSPVGAPGPHLGTGDHSIGRELFPQFLIIDGVIQVLHIQVHTLEGKDIC